MDATERERLYVPTLKLTIEFPGRKEQLFWQEDHRLERLIGSIAGNEPWKNARGESLHRTLEIGQPIAHPEVHPEYGPDTEVEIAHKGLSLRFKQLHAYEEWAASMARSVREEMEHVLSMMSLFSSGLPMQLSLTYATMLLGEAKSYRVASDEGDVVRMPCGTLAVVTSYDFDCGGYFKILKLRPVCGPFRHLWLWCTGRLVVAEKDIDKLTKVSEITLGNI